MNLLDRLFPNRALREAADAGYAAVVAQARQPGFYRDMAVPDSLDGRFEMIVLHVFLVLERLRGEGAAADSYARALLETLVTDCDRSLREIGVGDLSVGRKVKQMAASFYGSAEAYDDALATDPAALEAALRRNVYGTLETVPAGATAALAGYVAATRGRLESAALADLLAGRFDFAGPPQVAENH